MSYTKKRSIFQAQFKEKLQGHRRIKNTSIRIELSPAKEETEGWTMADWQELADDFIREFDAVCLKRPDRDDDPHTHLANSQYVVSLHHDSKSQILHLHINANRIDMDGNVNNEYMIGKRATLAANKINELRGWVQSMTKREWNIDEITNACIEALKEICHVRPSSCFVNAIVLLLFVVLYVPLTVRACHSGAIVTLTAVAAVGIFLIVTS